MYHHFKPDLFINLYLDQPMLTLSPDTTQGSRATLPSDTWMLLGAVVILRSAGQK